MLDLQLGARVKREGLVQRFTSGKHFLQVEWFPDLPNAVKGLEKNFFSGFNYSIPKACAAVAGQLFIFLFPLIAIWFGGWGSVFAFAAAIAIMAFVYISMIRTISGDPAWDVLVLPFSVLLLVYVLLRSMVLTLLRGGISWRGTFYPIGELKKMRSSRS